MSEGSEWEPLEQRGGFARRGPAPGGLVAEAGLTLRSSTQPLALASLLLLVVVGCWVISGLRMAGMDAGPTADLGATGWFIASWVAMMAAMMIPVVIPAAVRVATSRSSRALFGRVGRGGTFVAGYLLVWAAGGVVVFELLLLGRHVAGHAFGWSHAGRWASVVVLTAAASYQLTVRKRGALERCRRTTRLDGPAVLGGIRAGMNCLESSWAMMGALFALGVMSLLWMAVVALLIAAERLPRASAPGRIAGAVVLLALALGVAFAPGRVPGLTIPGSPAAMRAMEHMSSGARMGGAAMGNSAAGSMK